MSYQYAPLNRTKICAYCGTEFPITRGKRNAKYCSEECSTNARLEKARQYKANKRAEERNMPKASANEFISRPRFSSEEVVSHRRQQTDWDRIVAICEQHKVSYGYASAMGLLD